MIRKLALITCVLLICSCSKDETIASKDELPLKSDVVTFDIDSSVEWVPDVIGGGEVPASKGEKRSVPTRSESLPLECEGYEGTQIFMYMIEEDNLEKNHVQTIDTRDGEGSPDLGIYAFRSDTEEYAPSAVFMDNLNLSTYGTESNPYIYWPGNGTWLKFFAYMPYADPVEGLSVAVSEYQAEFTYTVPTDLSKQCDIMDGASALIAGENTGVVQITLEHVLSQIRVKAGTLDEGLINSISFRNIYSKGDRIMASGTGWANTSEPVDYEQDFDPGIKPSSGVMIGETMYLLPQTLRDDAIIEISMTVTSVNPEDNTERKNDYILTKKLKNFTGSWTPDKIYTYVISTPHEVEVEITDNVEYQGDYPVKKDLVIRNTGLADAYIRVAIAGAWMVDDETDGMTKQLVVSEWKDTDGEYTWAASKPVTGTTNANNWRLGSDGYYYYMKKTVPGEALKTLFESYKLTASAPMIGAYLELSILAQGLYTADAQEVFPVEIYDNLEK